MIIEFKNISEEALTYLIRLDYIKMKLNNINYIKHPKNSYSYAKTFDVSISNRVIIYGDHKLICQLKYVNKCVKILNNYVYQEINLDNIEICKCSKTSNNILYLIENINTNKKRIVCKNCNLYFLDKLKKMASNFDYIENRVKEKNEPKYNYFNRDVFLSFIFDNFHKKGWILGSDYNIIQDSSLEFINTRNNKTIEDKYNKYKEEIEEAKKIHIKFK